MISSASRLMEITRSELLSFQHRITVLIAISIGALLAIIIAVLLMLNKVILNPILAIQEGAKVIGKGDLKYRIKIDSDDELGALATSFNNMSGKLKEYYADLENKVKERTKELELAKKIAEKKAKKLEDMKTATLNILEDVKEAEEDTRKAKMGIERSNEAIFITDKNAVIQYVNPAFTKIYGYKGSEAIGNTLQMLKAGTMPRDHIKVLWEKLLNKEAVTFEMFNKTKDGHLVNIRQSANPILDKDGEIVGFMAIQTDITKEKEIDRAKNEFVSLASHQLRTPLTGIKWLIQAVLKRGSLNKWQIEFLQDALKSNDRMIGLVNDLLNISRLEAGVIGIVPKRTDLIKLVEELIREAKISSEKKKQKIKFKKPRQKVIFSLDQQLIGQVITNLISNAIKYSDNIKTITISVKKKEREVDVSVQDQGVGLSKNDQEKLFTKFFRSEQAAKISTTGSGLGLYIIKKILDAYGGKIKCRSALGKGATFTITLPLKGPSRKGGQKELIIHKIS